MLSQIRDAPIAQLVEQMTLNHWVLGSSPRGRTILLSHSTEILFDRILQMVPQWKAIRCKL